MGGTIEPISKDQIISNERSNKEHYKRALEDILKAKTLKEAKNLVNKALEKPKEKHNFGWRIFNKYEFKS